ncbi:hypothetical protein D6T64_08805 [Cryobacterium melibiosiphilum]|uniref:Uncharacterized protein n=1 Tax=Cryobacterium melibiosiphilum TaxID=995039 RepID=A0A3A5MPJ1_9MICO|nr:hypothetical protein [Cryobacterium melibiosiphilum]RJT88873.1 hypothetical protein D6T64_08805 [Cryobacterium melibiosiphilum]
MELDAYPTRVILMEEYTVTLPLWDRSPSPDKTFGPFEPGDLGLPPDLEARLAAYNQRFERLMGSEFEWPSEQEHLDFVIDGHLLAAALQRAFGHRVLVLYREDDSELSRIPRPTAAPTGSGSVQFMARQNGMLKPLTMPDHPPGSVVQQIVKMDDAEIEAAGAGIDVAALTWQPQRMPTRILLRAGSPGSPLADRSPLFGLTDDRLEPAALGLSAELTARLQAWNIAGLAPYVEYLVVGHELAAAVQREIGPQITVLFPEADAARSRPAPELVAMLDRFHRLTD